MNTLADLGTRLTGVRAEVSLGDTSTVVVNDPWRAYLGVANVLRAFSIGRCDVR